VTRDVPQCKNLLSQSARFLLSDVDAGGIVPQLKDRVKGTWYDRSSARRPVGEGCERIAGAFAILVSISSMSAGRRHLTWNIAPILQRQGGLPAGRRDGIADPDRVVV